MAGRKPLDALQMQDLKYGNTSPQERDRVAADLRAAGRRSEALLLFEGRPDHPFVREEAAWAVEHGSAFHLLALRRLGKEVGKDELRACARQAEARGRWMDARNAWRAAGDDAEVLRIAEHLPEALRPEPEEAPEA